MSCAISTSVVLLLGCAVFAHGQRPPADDEDFAFGREGSGHQAAASPSRTDTDPPSGHAGSQYGSVVHHSDGHSGGSHHYGTVVSSDRGGSRDYGKVVPAGRATGAGGDDHYALNPDQSAEYGSGYGSDDDYYDDDELYDGEEYGDSYYYEDEDEEEEPGAGADGRHSAAAGTPDHFEDGSRDGHVDGSSPELVGVVKTAPDVVSPELVGVVETVPRPDRPTHPDSVQVYGTETGQPHQPPVDDDALEDWEDPEQRDNDIDLAPDATADDDNSIVDGTVASSGTAGGMGAKALDRSTSFFAQPGILAAVVGGAVVGLLCAILLVMLIVYRMRKKDEGSYALDEPKRSLTGNSYAKNNNREFYA